MKEGTTWLAAWENIPDRKQQGKCSEKGQVSVCLRTSKKVPVREQGEGC